SHYCCLLYILPADRMVFAGRSMFLLVVIIPARCFVPAGSYGLCWWLRVHAGRHTSAGGFISTGGVVYAVKASVQTAELVCAGSIMFQLVDLFLLSPLRYALTHDPPVVFDSLVKQFWATAVVRPNKAGPHDLVATIDGHEVVVTAEPTPERQPTPERPLSPPPSSPETEWVVSDPVSPIADWRPWPYVHVHFSEPESLPFPPEQTFLYEERVEFGPMPRPTGCMGRIATLEKDLGTSKQVMGEDDIDLDEITTLATAALESEQPAVPTENVEPMEEQEEIEYDTAGWSVFTGSHSVSTGSLQSCWYNHVSVDEQYVLTTC
nr:hypothetical protein [Tanacetum cinerariifolium]